jgi:hypothetical protein
MKHAQISEKTILVEGVRHHIIANIIELREGTTQWEGLAVIRLSDEPGAHGLPVQPGDLFEPETGSFAAGPVSEAVKSLLLEAVDLHAADMKKELSATILDHEDLPAGFATLKKRAAQHDAYAEALKERIRAAANRFELPAETVALAHAQRASRRV